MDSKEWFEAGEKIGDLVQSAIDSSNYQALNESINKVINDAMKVMRSGLDGQSSMAKRSKEDIGQGRSYRDSRTAYSRVSSDDPFLRAFRERGDGGAQDSKLRRPGRSLFGMIFGFIMTGVCAMSLIATGILNMMTGGMFLFPTILLVFLTLGFGRLGLKSTGRHGIHKRLETYLDVMGTRDTCTFEELAAGSGQSVSRVKKDIKKAIRRNMFVGEAYIDAEETCLMTTHSAYRQYQETMSAARAREAEEANAQQRRRDAEKHMEKYSDETRTILQEGQDFIAHIHECNEKIPGEEMSEKLDQLEKVVSRIFTQVEKKPDSAPDLHKMMSYYIPVTRKLLDAYVELGDSSLQGENVIRTRKEIEMSIDTINTAFEAFLDNFFEDTAWDISSDISTLKTMMARDGLTGRDDFKSSGRIGTVAADLQAGQAASGGAAAAAPDREEAR